MEEFKYLGLLFPSDRKMEREIDCRIRAAGAELSSLPFCCDKEGAEP